MEREMERAVHDAFVEIAKSRSWHDEGDLTEAHAKLQGAYASAVQATPEMRCTALRALEDAVTRELYKLDPYVSAEQLEKQRLDRQIDALTQEYYSAKVNAQNAESELETGHYTDALKDHIEKRHGKRLRAAEYFSALHAYIENTKTEARNLKEQIRRAREQRGATQLHEPAPEQPEENF
jgi:hypothetical protein